MSVPLKLHELSASPNNVRVRIALAFKGLDYERIPLHMETFPGDRNPLIEVSRQPRTPVLVHGDTVIYDSRGIARYLDANFPDTPTLFSEDYAEFGEIERWEAYSQIHISEPVGMLFGQAFAPEPDAQVIAQANELLDGAIQGYEEALEGKDFLLGNGLTSADICCASVLYLADQTEAGAAGAPISTFFRENMHIGPNRTNTRAWVRRVVALDPVKGRQDVPV